MESPCRLTDAPLHHIPLCNSPQISIYSRISLIWAPEGQGGQDDDVTLSLVNFCRRNLTSVIRLREGLYYRGFLEEMYKNFVGT